MHFFDLASNDKHPDSRCRRAIASGEEVLRPVLAACRLYEKSNAGLHVRDHMNDMPMVLHPKKAHPPPLASQSWGRRSSWR
jgi:hypothetical protein